MVMAGVIYAHDMDIHYCRQMKQELNKVDLVDIRSRAHQYAIYPNYSGCNTYVIKPVTASALG